MQCFRHALRQKISQLWKCGTAGVRQHVNPLSRGNSFVAAPADWNEVCDFGTTTILEVPCVDDEFVRRFFERTNPCLLILVVHAVSFFLITQKQGQI